MFRLGIFTFVAGALQLSVPSYALRLVRRFGTQQVGSFVAMAFAALALVHLVGPWRAIPPGSGFGVSMEAAYAIGSVLLLVGMGHLESLLDERRQAKEHRSRLSSDWETKVEQKSRVNQELTQNIVRREQLAKTLAESEAQYRALFTQNPQAMLIVDLRSMKILAANVAAVHQYGFEAEEFLGLRAQDLLESESIQPFVEDFSRPCSDVQSRGFWRHRRKDQTLIEVEVAAVDLKYADCPARLLLSTDIGQRRRREMELLQKQKTETITQMAAGAAHHFNNILTIIDGYTGLLLRRSEDPRSAEQLTRIGEATSRAASLTSQLVAAAGRQLVKPEPIELNGFVQKMAPAIQGVIGERVTLQTAFGANLPHIMADPRHLEQIIINLVRNAEEAMGSIGKLTITTAPIRLSEAHARRELLALPGQFVCLAVHDTGCGMNAEVQSHVFEPFFTTKDTGKGTGLALASVNGIVRQHGGWIEFSTEEGLGAEFRVFFPCAAVQPSAKQQLAASAPVPARPKTVLLVETEDRARTLARFVLERHGYRVIEADDGPTALLLWQGNGAKVDLVLANITMRDGQSGEALVKQLQETRPELKVIYSGDIETDGEANKLASTEGTNFVAKPYSQRRLLEAVNGCLAV